MPCSRPRPAYEQPDVGVAQVLEVVRRRLPGDGDPTRQAEHHPAQVDQSPDQQGDAQRVPPRRAGGRVASQRAADSLADPADEIVSRRRQGREPIGRRSRPGTLLNLMPPVGFPLGSCLLHRGGFVLPPPGPCWVLVADALGRLRPIWAARSRSGSAAAQVSGPAARLSVGSCVGHVWFLHRLVRLRQLVAVHVRRPGELLDGLTLGRGLHVARPRSAPDRCRRRRCCRQAGAYLSRSPLPSLPATYITAVEICLV